MPRHLKTLHMLVIELFKSHYRWVADKTSSLCLLLHVTEYYLSEKPAPYIYLNVYQQCGLFYSNTAGGRRTF